MVARNSQAWYEDGAIEHGWFCVKDVRCLLDDAFLPKADVPTRWIKSIPIKINIFALKLCLDRLPTRVNLAKRNVAVANLLCPLCESGMEDAAHLFFRCDMAKDVMFLGMRTDSSHSSLVAQVMNKAGGEFSVYGNESGKLNSSPIGNIPSPMSFANLVKGDSRRKTINSHPLFMPAKNGVDLYVSKESVKFHDVPITAFTKDGLSAIATKLNNPLMLDSYTAAMCIDSWGKASYTRAMVELKADVELRDTIVVVIPKLSGDDACPKKIASDILKNSKMPRQPARGPPVGLKPKSTFVYHPVSNKKPQRLMGIQRRGMGNQTPSTNATPVVARINDLERQMLDKKLMTVDDQGKPLKMKVMNNASASKPNNSMEDQLYQPTTLGDVFLLARTIEARFDDQAAPVAGTSAGLEANKVVNDGDDSESSGLVTPTSNLESSSEVKVLNWVRQTIDVESTSDNDARDQAGELETKMLVDGKQYEAKMVVVANEQNSDEPDALEGNRVIVKENNKGVDKEVQYYVYTIRVLIPFLKHLND
nr:RNA-directed DNA polymerase, eukaryota [Tanacetum cinerariifolium]